MVGVDVAGEGVGSCVGVAAPAVLRRGRGVWEKRRKEGKAMAASAEVEGDGTGRGGGGRSRRRRELRRGRRWLRFAAKEEERGPGGGINRRRGSACARGRGRGVPPGHGVAGEECWSRTPAAGRRRTRQVGPTCQWLGVAACARRRERAGEAKAVRARGGRC